MYAEHDVIVLRRDLPDRSLVEGDVGTVGVYGHGGYEVEFTAADGSTLAVVTVTDDDIRPGGAARSCTYERSPDPNRRSTG